MSFHQGERGFRDVFLPEGVAECRVQGADGVCDAGRGGIGCVEPHGDFLRGECGGVALCEGGAEFFGCVTEVAGGKRSPLRFFQF